VRILVDLDGVLIEGTEQELADLASALLEGAVLGQVAEPVLLTSMGVATVRIKRTDETDDDTTYPEGEDGRAEGEDETGTGGGTPT